MTMGGIISTYLISSVSSAFDGAGGAFDATLRTVRVIILPSAVRHKVIHEKGNAKWYTRIVSLRLTFLHYASAAFVAWYTPVISKFLTAAMFVSKTMQIARPNQITQQFFPLIADSMKFFFNFSVFKKKWIFMWLSSFQGIFFGDLVCPAWTAWLIKFLVECQPRVTRNLDKIFLSDNRRLKGLVIGPGPAVKVNSRRPCPQAASA